jgi:hypothetical protein
MKQITKNILFYVVILLLCIFMGCSKKPPSMLVGSGFRLTDKPHLTALTGGDAFMVEDYSSSYATKYTTMDDISTYFSSSVGSFTPTAIASLSEVTMDAADYIVIWDESNSSTLKKASCNIPATYTEVNEGNSTSVFVSPDALAKSHFGMKDIGFAIHDDGDNTTVADGEKFYVVPSCYDTYSVVDATCGVSGLNGATGGATTVQLRKVRNGVEHDVFTTQVTISHDEYFASDESVNATCTDLNTGDLLYWYIDGITTGHPHQGLGCTMVIQKPEAGS